MEQKHKIKRLQQYFFFAFTQEKNHYYAAQGRRETEHIACAKYISIYTQSYKYIFPEKVNETKLNRKKAQKFFIEIYVICLYIQ